MQRFYIENQKLTLKSKYFEFSSIQTVEQLFNVFLACWSIDTCSPKFREKWSKQNPTAGQCSITSIIIQEFFGGEIYRANTFVGLHCFNVIDGVIFDITNEQFGNERVIYNLEIPFDKDEFLRDRSKLERYLLLKRYFLIENKVKRF